MLIFGKTKIAKEEFYGVKKNKKNLDADADNTVISN